MKAILKKPATIDGYIAACDPSVQPKLDQLRNAIRGVAKNAEEVISYGMPGFRLDGMLVWFAANKEHIGFYPTPSAIMTFKKELSPYHTSKGAIQFPYEGKLPVGLIKNIVRYRLKQNAEKAKMKKRR
ncbi:MAG TPA: DUF1801 domain-containing protein [Chitinophagaceae bacterium]|jgi:uncharacterized protein YdhG (YjbR/CyaY superfamily)